MQELPLKMTNEQMCVEVLKNSFSFVLSNKQLNDFEHEYEQLNLSQRLETGYETNADNKEKGKLK